MIHHVLVPGLLEPPPAGMETADILRFPCLERLLARADKASAPANLEASLLTLFQLELSTPLAPLCWLAESGETSSDWILQATPVYFRADRDRLLLFQLQASQIDLQEAREFAVVFNRHFSEDGLRLKISSALRWYLFSSRAVSSRFFPVSDVAGRSVAEYMPQGEDAGFWRGVINETQMLYFQFQENRERSSIATGVWFSGAGMSLPLNAVAPAICEGNNRLLTGLDVVAAGEDKNRAVYVMEDVQAALENRDGIAWIHALEALERKICRLTSASDGVDVYPCQGVVYQWKKWMNYRVWRKTARLDQNCPKGT